MKKYLHILYLILIISSCSDNQKGDLNVKNIIQDLPRGDSELNLSEFYKFNKAVRLQSNNSSLIDFVNKVMINDEWIFIKGGNSLYKFDRNGNFYGKISKGKGGPDEFVNLTDALLIPDQARIWIYDSNQRSIFQYNYDLEMEIDYPLNYPLFGIEKVENGLLGTSGYLNVTDNFSSLFLFGGDNLVSGFKFLKSDLSFNSEKSKYLHIYRHDFFSRAGQGYNFVNSFNDTIYFIDKTMEVVPKYFIDFGSNKVLEEDLIEKGYTSIVDVFQFINLSEKSFNVGNVVESEFTLLYRFFNKGQAYLSVYDKKNDVLKSGKRISFDYLGVQIVLDLDEEISFGTTGNNQAYIVIPAESSVLKEYQEVFNVQDGDNPLIILFHEK
jgi:hypothetical protein